MKTKLAFFFVGVLAIVCLLIQKRELNREQMENASLRREIAAGLSEKEESHVSEAGTGLARTDDGATEERSKEHSELLRLRGEVGVLRQQLLEKRQTATEDSALLDTNYEAKVKEAQSMYHMPLEDLIHYGLVPQRPNDHQ